MSLNLGTRLRPYEATALIGEGGMGKVAIYFLGLLLLSGAAIGAGSPAQTTSQAEDVERGVQLLRRAQEAVGGVARLLVVRDTTHVMEIMLEPAAGGYAMTQVSRYVAPSYYRIEQDTPAGRIIVYSDGSSGWVTTPQGTVPLSPDVLASAQGVIFRQPSGLLLSDRNPSRSVKAVAIDAVEVSSADGQLVRIEFDPGTGLPLQQSYVVTAANGDRVTRTETLSEWRAVDGLRFPFKAMQFENGSKVLELIVSDYQVNSGLTAMELGTR